MAKSRRVGRSAPTRGGATARQRAAEDLLPGEDAPRRGAPRVAAAAPRDRTGPAKGDPPDDGLDAWLAPDEDDDADLDQWLHDHGVDGGADGPNS